MSDNLPTVEDDDRPFAELDGQPWELLADGEDGGPKPASKTRVFISQMVYYQPDKGEGVGTDARYNHYLDSDEQPYVRRLKVKQAWQALDLGWLNEEGQGVSILTVRNDGGDPFVKNPTDEEAEIERSRVLELGVAFGEGPDDVKPFCKISPGRLEVVETLEDPSTLRLRSRAEWTRATLTAYPK